jgi:hypothetical protein
MAIRLIALPLLLAAFAGCRDILSSTRAGFEEQEPRQDPDTVQIDTAWLFDAVRDHLHGSGITDTLTDWIRAADSLDLEGKLASDSTEAG